MKYKAFNVESQDNPTQYVIDYVLNYFREEDDTTIFVFKRNQILDDTGSFGYVVYKIYNNTGKHQVYQ